MSEYAKDVLLAMLFTFGLPALIMVLMWVLGIKSEHRKKGKK